ncbi:hypothetical protein SAMN06265218_106172 [Fodinibius sediminis]|uniref:Uncharacterized protein n=1 Tax=Fodinibius sediminis TaxID=1214077 RepID=A0A521CKW2_9BACT|nr:hypothetical protein SAMN06265218_106172 [Fodinibius sediminis]
MDLTINIVHSQPLFSKDYPENSGGTVLNILSYWYKKCLLGEQKSRIDLSKK